ncbi:TonB-dependent receptor [Psychroflexus salinarum]|uniref:TonB-dependent receptor n=1 Tax=Psychroflexus salinarum TaxID=546024 RepID=A0ABW3GQS9_9FLAO
MPIKITIILALFASLWSQQLLAQNRDFSIFTENETLELKQLFNRIETEEKSFLSMKVSKINSQLKKGDLSSPEAEELKMEAAKESAINIEEAQELLIDWASFQKRKYGEVDFDQFEDYDSYLSIIDELGLNPSSFTFNLFELSSKKEVSQDTLKNRDLPYSSRTSGSVFSSLSFNNAVLEGGSIDDTPFKFGGSRSFEIGYEWSTRIFKESNFLRINYGVSVQFNGLKPKNNNIFVENGHQTNLEPFEFDLDKSKFRMDNLIVPVHLQFGSSKTTVLNNGNKRFSDHDFKVGLGGFAGINLLNTQKLKYNNSRTDVKLRERDDFNTNDLLYGLSAYIGWENVAVFAQYNLNSIFSDNLTDLNNFQIGVRTHWD